MLFKSQILLLLSIGFFSCGRFGLEDELPVDADLDSGPLDGDRADSDRERPDGDASRDSGDADSPDALDSGLRDADQDDDVELDGDLGDADAYDADTPSVTVEITGVTQIGGADSDICFCFAMNGAGVHAVTGGVGAEAEFGDGDSIAGEPGTFVASYDRDGALLWVERRGGRGTDRGNGVAVDPSGNVYPVGEFRATLDMGDGPLPNQGNMDGFAARFSPTGGLEWAVAGGSSAFDLFHAPAVYAGTMYVVGGISGDALFEADVVAHLGGSDSVVARYDASGDLDWAVSIAATGPDVACAVVGLPEGAAYVGGEQEGTMRDHVAEGTDGYVARLDETGAVEWTLSLGGAGFARVYGVAADVDENLYLIGEYDGIARLQGAETRDSEERDVVIAKASPTGDVLWFVTGGGPDSDFGHGIIVDGESVYVTGGQRGDMRWHDEDLPSLTASGSFVARLSAETGRVIWSLALGGVSSLGIGVSNDGLIGVGGHFSGSALEGTAHELTGRGGGDAVIIRLRESVE